MTLLAGLDIGTSSVKGLLVDAVDGDGRRARRGRASTVDAAPGLGRAGSRGLVGRRAGGARGAGRRQARSPASGSPARCTASSRSTPPGACCARRCSGTTGAPAPSARRSRSASASSELIALTGNRALTGFTAPKLRWLARHEPDVYARIDRIMLPKDYVRLRLCGEHATDVADASGTLLFDVAQRRWSDAVVEALEVDPAWLPRALESPEVSGVTAAGIPVAAGAGDQAAGALGVGVDRPGPASVVLGTSRRRVRRLRRLHRRPAGARARLLPRGAGRLAQHGRHALRRRLAALAARRGRARRTGLRRARRRGRALGAGRRGAHLPALPRRRAHAARRPRRARRLHRPLAAPRPRRARARGARGRRVRPARRPRPRRRDGLAAARPRPRLRRRRA